MSNTFWVLLAVAAIAIFWAVGAYSRLKRLHRAVHTNFSAFSTLLHERLQWLLSLAPSADVSVHADDSPAGVADMPHVAKIVAAAAQCRRLLVTADGKPLDAAVVRALDLACSTLQSAWVAGAEGLPANGGDQNDETGESTSTPPTQDTWQRMVHGESPARVAFNRAVEDFIRARGQFPANGLAILLRMRAVTPLSV